jgi:hypothetical protein
MEKEDAKLRVPDFNIHINTYGGSVYAGLGICDIIEELAKQLIPEGAQEALDTLAEIAAWIQEHPEDVAAINLAIDNLEKLVGKIPEDATATDIVGYIAEVVAAEKARAEGVESGLDTRLQAVETAIGQGGSVDAQIDAKIAALDANVESTSSTLVSVKVDEVDGKVTAVTVTEDLANTFDAKGAAAAAQAAAEADATAKANAAQTAAETTAQTKAETEAAAANAAITAIDPNSIAAMFAPATEE